MVMPQLSLARENMKKNTIENMIAAGALTRDQAARYGKVLDSFNDLQLTRVWLLSDMYREETGEILHPE
ncbi:unnamed protein product [marine sediment metagenome]|uniref:Uncharacterized protein n=1 Tax=marine sediment metagenome TaxID=412755 RepID=X1U842_9ZZZZ